MKIEFNSPPSALTQNTALGEPQNSTGVSNKNVRLDRWTASTTYEANTLVSSTSRSPATQAKIDALTEQLKQDTSFSKNKHRLFLDHPVGQELATETILSDEKLQEQVAKCIWDTMRSVKGYVPPSWKDIDVRAMLLSSDELTRKEALSGYYSALLNKAVTVGLNDTEKLLSADLERTSNCTSSTFDQKMNQIFDKVRAGFKANGMVFDENKSYEFYLDTEVYRFSVVGGSDEENALIEKVLNTSNYSVDNLLDTLSAISNHRQEDGAYLPWIANILGCKDAVPLFGVVSVSVDYAEKMEQLYPAHDRFRMDRDLKAQYGFGVDDLSYSGGKIIGKTPAAQAVIDNDEGDFMKKTGYAFINLTKRYTGTPKFTDPIFTYHDGKFQTSYQIFDEPCEGVTNSSAIIANAQRELDQKLAVWENGRTQTLIKDQARFSNKIDALAQKFVQDRAFAADSNKHFWNHPIGRELAKQLILSNDNLLMQVAEMMRKNLAETMGQSNGSVLPTNDWGIDVKSILLGEDEGAIDHVLINYNYVLNQKAHTVGLTKIERCLR